MSKACNICGGLIVAQGEVLGYSGPLCSGNHAITAPWSLMEEQRRVKEQPKRELANDYTAPRDNSLKKDGNYTVLSDQVRDELDEILEAFFRGYNQGVRNDAKGHINALIEKKCQEAMLRQKAYDERAIDKRSNEAVLKELVALQEKDIYDNEYYNAIVERIAALTAEQEKPHD